MARGDKPEDYDWPDGYTHDGSEGDCRVFVYI
jgi:hypothetical protein